jgi:hypothetical protein
LPGDALVSPGLFGEPFGPVGPAEFGEPPGNDDMGIGSEPMVLLEQAPKSDPHNAIASSARGDEFMRIPA